MALNYLMQKSGAEWKIMNVYSLWRDQPACDRRSEFVADLRSGGPDALISAPTKQSEKLLAGGRKVKETDAGNGAPGNHEAKDANQGSLNAKKKK